MTTNKTGQEEKRKALIEKLWFRTTAEAGTTEAEKAEATSKMNEILTNLLKHLVFDWTTGKFINGKSGTAGMAGKAKQQPKQNQQQQQQQPKQEQPKKEQTNNGTWTTKELADFLSKMFGKEISAKTLRRNLRTMDEYNDHVTTHYSWSGQNDEAVQRIIEFMKTKGKTA